MPKRSFARFALLLFLIFIFSAPAPSQSPKPDLSGLDVVVEQVMKELKARAEDEKNRKKETRPTLALKEYAGGFEHPAYQTLAVTLDGETLKFDLHGLTGNLKHYHYDVFQGAGGMFDGRKTSFLMNGKGEIDRVSILLEPGVKEIVFTRRSAKD